MQYRVAFDVLTFTDGAAHAGDVLTDADLAGYDSARLIEIGAIDPIAATPAPTDTTDAQQVQVSSVPVTVSAATDADSMTFKDLKELARVLGISPIPETKTPLKAAVKEFQARSAQAAADVEAAASAQDGGTTPEPVVVPENPPEVVPVPQTDPQPEPVVAPVQDPSAPVAPTDPAPVAPSDTTTADPSAPAAQ